VISSYADGLLPQAQSGVMPSVWQKGFVDVDNENAGESPMLFYSHPKQVKHKLIGTKDNAKTNAVEPYL
jgi:hypothetical protein